MGLENFIPEIWSSSLLVQLRKSLVFGALANRDYEGEIRGAGDTVDIVELGSVAVGDYTKNGSIKWQTMDSAAKKLLIDKQKYFAVKLDDIDRAQSKINVVDGLMQESAYSVADVVDQDLSLLYSEAGNTVSALTVTAGNVIQNVANLALKLDEENVPQSGRYLIVPPWYNQYLTLAASGAVSATATVKILDNGAILNGWVGRFWGFDVLVSNNVYYSGSVYYPMALNKTALAYAGQISKIESTRIEDGFQEGIKGLYVYGAKVVRPKALVTCAATRG